MIIIDENVEQYWINRVEALGFEFISIRNSYQGIDDLEVIDLVRKHGGILVTEDKDFGELVFAHGVDGVSVLFIRYDQPQYFQIEEYVIRTLLRFRDMEISGFITITKNKIRIRKI